MRGPDHDDRVRARVGAAARDDLGSTGTAPWSAAISTHSTATFSPTAITRRKASATASEREPPPTFAEAEKARSSPERTWVPVTTVAPASRSVRAVSGSNSHSPGVLNPTTCVTTTRRRPVSIMASRNWRAVRPLVDATTTVSRPSACARSTANRAASAVFPGPGCSK